MKVSNIGLVSQKLGELDKQFPVQDMLLKTGQLEQYAGGIFGFGHIPFLVENKIKEIIIDVLTQHNCALVSLPILQPEKMWEDSGRLEKYIQNGQMFRCLTDKGNYCLAPTAEEAIVEFAKRRLPTYKNLPNVFFQIGDKFRNEIRHRGYLLRGKCFEMLDAYSFCRNQEEQDKIYADMKVAYAEIFDRLGLKVQPVCADNGDIGGSKSEEYMSLSDIGEDNILFDETTGQALNAELLEKPDAKEYLATNYNITNTSSLISKKAVELGHIFDLGTKYSQTMNGNFIDETGKQQKYVMGCYGIGVSRTLALIYENSIIKKDGKFDGISLPKSVAPYSLYIIPKTDDVIKYDLALNLYNELNSAGAKVLFDDRKEISIGAKIKDAKLTGVSHIAIIGKSVDEGFIEVENIVSGNKEKLKIDNFVNDVMKII